MTLEEKEDYAASIVRKSDCKNRKKVGLKEQKESQTADE
jgi:hypothetical protein